MSVTTITRIAVSICNEAGVQCRYESDAGRFRWNFYRDGERVKSICKPSAVIMAAQKIVDAVNYLPHSRIVPTDYRSAK